MWIIRLRLHQIIFLLFVSSAAFASENTASNTVLPQTLQTYPTYVLGPDDQITLQVLDAEEISNKPIRIETSGYINLPMVGRLQAAGLTVEQLEAALSSRLKAYIQRPQVAVTVNEFRSQPVSVIGSVGTPGVHQLQGRKTLVEILSMAGGLKPDAGYSVKITRRREWGPIPLPKATQDPTGEFSIAEVNLKDVMEARNPEENILIKPYDVISVPKSDLIYVLGEVKKSGGFVLNERKNVSILEALSMAEGLQTTAVPQNSKILRVVPGQSSRTEIRVDLKKILAGKATDVALQREDILFVPSSVSKKILTRTLETAVSTGTRILIWGRW